MAARKAHAGRAAEVVHDEREVAQVEGEHEALEVVDMILQPVGSVLRRRALAESHMVDGDDAMVRRPDGNLAGGTR